MPNTFQENCQRKFGYVNPEYLKVALDLFAPIKQQSYERLHAAQGLNFLDVGCGSGIDTSELARRVQSSGLVVGIDFDQEMIRQAEAQIKRLDLHSHTSHIHAQALALPFSDWSFDGARSERLFMHLTDGLPVLAEMVRVTKPQGWVVVAETDWNSLSMCNTQPTISQTLSQLRIERYLTNGYSAQQLYSQFSTMKLQSITIDILPIFTTNIGLFRFLTKMDELEDLAIREDFLTTDEMASWKAAQHAFTQGTPFWGSVNVLIMAGQVP